MVRRGVRDDEAGVVVHEDRQVHSLVASEQKREDVRLPELIRRSSLEAPLRMLSWPRRLRRRLEQPGLVQNAPHLALAHAERLKASERVSYPPCPVLRVLLAKLDDSAPPCLVVGRPPACRGPGGLRHQRLDTSLSVRVQPILDRRPTDAERPRELLRLGSTAQHLVEHPHSYGHRVRSSVAASPTASEWRAADGSRASLPSSPHVVLLRVCCQTKEEGGC